MREDKKSQEQRTKCQNLWIAFVLCSVLQQHTRIWPRGNIQKVSILYKNWSYNRQKMEYTSALPDVAGQQHADCEGEEKRDGWQ